MQAQKDDMVILFLRIISRSRVSTQKALCAVYLFQFFLVEILMEKLFQTHKIMPGN